MVNLCVCINIENMGYSCKGPMFNLQYWLQTLQLLVGLVSPKTPSSSLLGGIYMNSVQRQTLRDVTDGVKPVLQTGQQLCKESWSDNWHMYQSLGPTKGKKRHDSQLTSRDIQWTVYIYSHIYTNIWILNNCKDRQCRRTYFPVYGDSEQSCWTNQPSVPVSQ